MSERIGNKFMGYIYEVILTEVGKLQREGHEGRLREFLIRSIIHGGHGGNDAAEHSYVHRLITLLSEVDHVTRSDVDDYIQELRNTYPDVHSGI
jgi:hypothetical protein